MKGVRLGALFLVLLLILLAVIGTRFLERSLKTRLETGLGQAFGCTISSGRLEIHWPVRTLEVANLRIACPLSGSGPSQEIPPLVYVKRLSAHFELLSLLNRVMALDSLEVEDGKIQAISSGGRDNYRTFLSRWVSGVHPKVLSGGATIRRISIRRTDLSVRMADQELGVTFHASQALLRPNLFMNRFRLEVPNGTLTGEIGGRSIASSTLRATASFAEGGVPDLEILASSPSGSLKIQGQVLSFGTEPVVSLFVQGQGVLTGLAAFLPPGTPAPGGNLTFRTYLHGRVDHLRARAVVTGEELQVGGVGLRHLRMILSMSPGLLEARPVEVTVGRSRIRGRLWANLSGPHPMAKVRLHQVGHGGVMGTFSMSASGVVPLPKKPEEWGQFLSGLGHLAGVS